MITESISKPDPTAARLSIRTVTRLGCPARDMLLVIIATSVCGKSGVRPLAWTINAGVALRFASWSPEKGPERFHRGGKSS